MSTPIQKILFGSPGTGKSHQIKNLIAPTLKIEVNSENYIPTVFHPEYTYGDFMGKLMPFTNDSSKVEYLFYRGHFLKALAQAYKNIILTYVELEENKEKVGEEYKKEIGKTAIKSFTSEETRELDVRKDKVFRNKPKNVLLVIDEINRGNSAAVFGTVFQLLDRESNGWSTYPISISDLEFKGLLQEMSFKYISYTKENKLNEEYYFDEQKIAHDKYNDLQTMIFEDINERNLINDKKIKIPANFSIVGTMNTSDNSIYFMDSAFKRRWDWEFIEIEDETQRALLVERRITLWGEDGGEWCSFVDHLNFFIRSNYKLIRKIEDKQLGYRFINKDVISHDDIKNKLMFFVWDSVFVNNKKPLVDLLGIPENELVTFGQFTSKIQVENFVNKILNLNV
jgi:5-methylcytosine-specific restriction protein B